MNLKIAMLGTRGLPATFGGIEHHVEEIGSRLVARGHEVTVYSERGYSGRIEDGEHLGMSVVQVPTVRCRSLEALAHSAVSTIEALRSRPDVFHYHAVGPGMLSPLPRLLSRSAVVQTIHGLDAERDKWGGVAQRVLRGATWMSARVPHATVTVSADLAEHYAARYDRRCVHITNGVTPHAFRPLGSLARKYRLRAGRYLLFVGRLVPEKRPDLLLRAFARVPTDLRLVLVGGSSYTDGYVDELQELAAEDPRVLMPGYAFGAELDEFFSNAAMMVQPSALEGLPLTLLEGIASGLPVVASDIAPHREVIGASAQGARLFRSDDIDSLTEQISLALVDEVGKHGPTANRAEDVRARFDWDRCVDQLEQVYYAAARRAA